MSCAPSLPPATVTAGPDSGRSLPLAPGRLLVGRSRACAWWLADPTVEPVHAVLAVAGDGTVAVTQLAGRAPIVVDGRAIGCDEVEVPLTSTLEIGDDRIELAGGNHDPASGGGRVVLGAAGSVRVVADLVRSDRELLVVRGDRAWGVADVGRSVIRSVCAQLARDAGAAGWQVHHRWREPVAPVDSVDSVDSGAPAPCVGCGSESAERTLLMTDHWRGFPATGRPVTVVLLADGDAPCPAAATAILQLGARWRGRYLDDPADPFGGVRLHVRGHGEWATVN